MIRDLEGLVHEELVARRDAATGVDRAVWCLLLREPDAGLDAIRAAVAQPPANEVARWQLVRLAFVLGDADRAAGVAGVEVVGAPPSPFVAGYREYVGAMLALAGGDDDRARDELASLAVRASGRTKLRSGHPVALADIPRGILHGDAAATAAAVDKLLHWHLRRARARSDVFNSARAMVCLDAVAALVVAARRSLAVEVAEVHRAAAVPILMLHVREWEGRPVAHGTRVDVTTDLVAGQWLIASGLDMPVAAISRLPQPRRPPTRPRRAEAPPEVIADELRHRLRSGTGTPWQKASWALMLGDAAGGRRALLAGAHQAADPRERFAYALVVGDEHEHRLAVTALREARQALERFNPPYAHTAGYLDLIADAVTDDSPAPTRADAHQLLGPLTGGPIACVGLLERDPSLLAEGLNTMLADHARALERRSSPPPAVCAAAVHVAVAARHVGIPIEIDVRYQTHEVPIDVSLGPSAGRSTGRVPCDLLGRNLWL